jgi:hypothetical protein
MAGRWVGAALARVALGTWFVVLGAAVVTACSGDDDDSTSGGTEDDPEHVDERRAEVGLDPLDDYLAELEEACAAEG